MAIVRNGSADLGNNAGAAGSWTKSYTTNTASNFVCFFVSGSGAVATNIQTLTTATYGGNTLSISGATTSGDSGVSRCAKFFYMFNPPSGANNLVVSQTSTGAYDDYILAVGADYGGVAAVGLDGTVTTYLASSAETSQSAPSGALANPRSWVISGCGSATTASLTNTVLTKVVNGVAFTLGFIFDTNGAAGAAGALANTYNFASGGFNAIVMGILPDCAVQLPVLGVGCSMDMLVGAAAYEGVRRLRRNQIQSRREFLHGWTG